MSDELLNLLDLKEKSVIDSFSVNYIDKINPFFQIFVNVNYYILIDKDVTKAILCHPENIYSIYENFLSSDFNIIRLFVEIERINDIKLIEKTINTIFFDMRMMYWYLSSCDVNSVTNPIPVKININIGFPDFWGLFIGMLNELDKFIEVDLSNSILNEMPGLINLKYFNKIVSIFLPNSLTTIGNQAFMNWTGLTSINIPESVTSIGSEAFNHCIALNSITIPEGVTSIGGFAFAGCISLTSIIIPDSVESIVFSAFRGCKNLTNIKIPNSVSKIGEEAFYGCDSLTSVNLPNNLTKINSIFCYCRNITSIILPESITSIGFEAFSHCISLNSITIPEGVTSIESYAFVACISLTNIIIPYSVINIGKEVFLHCKKLTNVTFEGNIPSDGFSKCNPFPGNLRAKYFSKNGGKGTYARINGVSEKWVKVKLKRK